MRITFFGSDLFSVPSLKALAPLADLRLVTRRLKPSGRGQSTIVIPPVVDQARAMDLAWDEIESEAEFNDYSQAYPSDLVVAVSYGRLIPASFLEKAPFGGLNVHPSLLPQYRGAAPLQRAIMDLHPSTGVSVQTLHPTKFDCGRVLWQQQVPIGARTTLPQLRDELAVLGAQGLAEVVSKELFKDPQRHIVADVTSSRAPLIERAEQKIDLRLPAAQTDAAGRALGKLWFEQLQTKKKKTRSLRVVLSDFEPVALQDSEPAGTIKIIGGGTSALLGLKVADGYIGARTVSVAGFKPESAFDYFSAQNRRGLTSRAL